jgi:hypothetical protein
MFHLIARTGVEHSNFVATRKCTMLAKKIYIFPRRNTSVEALG